MLKIKARFKFICWAILGCFLFTSSGFAATATLPVLSPSLGLAKPVGSAILRGVKIDPNNPLRLEFMIEVQQGKTVTKDEFDQLVGYFMAVLTIPEKDFWVNLSPYEKERVISPVVEQTEFGKGLLVEDYILKQLAAGLTNPQTDTGKDYWKALNNDKGSNFNKVWIMPEKAEIFENGNIAYVTQANYKVLTDADYLANRVEGSRVNRVGDNSGNSKNPTDSINSFKKNILPKIEADVNGGENFVQLRQMLSSFLLASWFKNKLKDSLYKYYINQNKVNGIDLADKNIKEKIYNQYVEAFKTGVYNYIKKERVQNKVIFRQYFSGGVTGFDAMAVGASGSHTTVVVGDGKNDASIMGDSNPALTPIDQMRRRAPRHRDPNIFGGRGRGLATSVIIGVAAVSCIPNAVLDPQGAAGAAGMTTKIDGGEASTDIAAGGTAGAAVAQGGTSGTTTAVAVAGTTAATAQGGAVTTATTSMATGGARSAFATLDPTTPEYKAAVAPQITNILTSVKSLRTTLDNLFIENGTPYTADGLLLLAQTVFKDSYFGTEPSDALILINKTYSGLASWLGDYATAASLVLDVAKKRGLTIAQAAAKVDAIRQEISTTYKGLDGYATALFAAGQGMTYAEFYSVIAEPFYSANAIEAAYSMQLALDLGFASVGNVERADVAKRLTLARDAIGVGATTQSAYDYVLAVAAGSKNPMTESAALANYYLADGLVSNIPAASQALIAANNRFKLVAMTRARVSSAASSGAAKQMGTDFVPLDRVKLQWLLQSNPAILTDFKAAINGQDKDTLGTATNVVSEALKALFERGLMMADMLPIVMDDGQFLGYDEDSRWVVDHNSEFNNGQPFVVLKRNLSVKNAIWALGHDFGEYKIFKENKARLIKYGEIYGFSAEQVAHIIQSAIEAVEHVRSRGNSLINMHEVMFRNNNGAIGFLRDLVQDERPKQNHIVRMWADHQKDDSFVEDYQEYQQRFKKRAEFYLLHSLELTSTKRYKKSIVDQFVREQQLSGDNSQGIPYYITDGMDASRVVKVFSALKNITASQAAARLIAVRMTALYGLDYTAIADIEAALNNETAAASDKGNPIDMKSIKAVAKEMMEWAVSYASSGAAGYGGIKMETNVTIKSGSKLIEIKVTPQMVEMMKSAKRVGYEVVAVGEQRPLKEALGL